MTDHDFVGWLKAAEIHWFFVQGEESIQRGLYVPGALSLLAGVEASIRFTVHQLDGRALEEDLGATLSNPLVRRAGDRGLPVQALAFPGEDDFKTKLASKEPYVEIVRTRHNLAHGNIVEYVNREHEIFTPECLRDLSLVLLGIAGDWARRLGEFRASKLG